VSRILLIGVEPGLARGLRSSLEQEGHELVATADGEAGEAGERAASRGGFDVILLDVAVPGRSGFRILETMRVSGDTTPVILLSTSSGEEDRIRGLQLGADDYLTGPFSVPELLARIRTRATAARKMGVLHDAIRATSNVRPLEALVDKALELTGAERGMVLLRNGGDRLHTMAARSAGQDLPADVRYSTTVAQRVWESGRAQVLLDPGQDGSWSGGSVVDLQLRHVLCAPLRADGEQLGLLYADSRVSAQGFGRADLELFETLASQCGVMVERSNLREAVKDKARMEKSLHEAQEVQRALQPERPEMGPRLDIAGLSRPMQEAGGDYLDYIKLKGERLALVLGDVSGHGIGAAMFMTAARSLLRAFLPREESLGAALAEVNRSMVRDMPVGGFMSLLVAELDTRTGCLRYASAGHNTALILRARSERFEELPRTGAALGVVEKERYRVAELDALGADDLLLVYTDGCTEAMNPERELFGIERLKRLLLSLRARSAPEVVSGIVGAVTRFAGRAGQSDDVSLVVAKGMPVTSSVQA